jgi:hypothetical protein
MSALELLQPLYRSLLLHPLLFLSALFFLLVAWGKLLKGYGGAAVFWHELRWTQFLNGFALTLLFANLCFVTYLRDLDQSNKRDLDQNNKWFQEYLEYLTREKPVPWLADWIERHSADGSQAREDPYWQGLCGYLLVTWVPLLLVLLAAGFTDLRRRWPLVVGVLVTIPVVPLFIMGFILVQNRAQYPNLKDIASIAVLGLAPGELERWVTRIFFLLFGIYAVLFILFRKRPAEAERSVISRCIFVLIIFAILLLAALVSLGVAATLLRFSEMEDSDKWKHTLATDVFGLVTLIYLLNVVLCLHPRVERIMRRYLATPVLGLALVVHMVVVVDTVIRFHFADAIVPAWAALLGLGILANSYRLRRLHFPGMRYDRIVRPADEDPLLEMGKPGDTPGRLRACLESLVRRLPPNRRDEWDVRIGQAADQTYETLLTWREDLVRLLEQPGRIAACLESLVRRLPPTRRDEWDARIGQAADQTYKTLLTMRDDLVRLLEQHELDKLDAWRRRTGVPADQKPKLAVVATVGGANRAALWTLKVLTELENLPGFPRHVRVITGASGGMVGACYYVATLTPEGTHASRARDRRPSQPLGKEVLKRNMVKDHLTPVLHRTIFRELPLLFLPVTYRGDRGEVLEETWSENLEGELDIAFRSLAAGEEEGWRPSLIVTPMLVEDGRQLLISNLFVQFMTENGGNFLQAPRTTGAGERPQALIQSQGTAASPEFRYSLSGLEFFQLFPDEHADFQLSTAARMNASFPYVSPAVDLPVAPRRRVVDAGYYDNYGVKTAAAWIYHYRQWLMDNTSGVVLLQLRDLASDQRRLSPGDGMDGKDTDRWNLYRGIEWLTGPLTGAASARQSVMSFRNDEQLDSLSNLFNIHKAKDFFTTVVFSFNDEVAMNWYLGPEDVQGIEDSWEEPWNQSALKALQDWWGTGAAK